MGGLRWWLSVVKNSSARAGNVGSVPEGGIGNPLDLFLPGKSHGQREPWQTTVHGVAKELNVTKQQQKSIKGGETFYSNIMDK